MTVKKSCVLVALVVFPLAVGHTVSATPITSATANYEVSGAVAGNTGTTSAATSYSRAPVPGNPGTSGSSGSGQVSAGQAGLTASSSYSNGLGMHGGGYISPQAGAALDRPVAETISFTSTATWEETFIAAEAGTYKWSTVVSNAEIHLWYDTYKKYLPASMDLSAGFEGIVTANGEELFRFGSTAHFTEAGGSSATHWGIGGAPQVHAYAGDPYFLAVDRYWNTGPYTFTKTIGDFAMGDLITMNLSISTYIRGTGQQNGARVLLENVTGYLTPTAEPVSSPVPEPATMLLMGIGLSALGGWKKKNRQS